MFTLLVKGGQALNQAHYAKLSLWLTISAALASSWMCAGLRVPSKRSSMILGKGIPIISIDTKHPGPVPMGPVGISPQAYNAGSGKKWNGWHTKNCLYADFLDTYVAQDPNQLAVLIDGSDMLFGGCDAEKMVESYHKIVNASNGAPVVSGAELGLWRATSKATKMYEGSLDHRRRAVLDAVGLPESVYGSHAFCKTDEDVGACSSPPRYKYLNAGFRMGPAKILADLSHQLCERHVNEQQFMTEILFQHPDIVTLDYTGELVISLHHFNRNMEFLNATNHVIHNTQTGAPACFLHGNGVDGKIMKDELIEKLKKD